MKQYSNQKYLDHSENSIRNKSYEVKKSNCIKPPVELVKLDEC